MIRHRIPGDGSCLFHALVQGRHHHKTGGKLLPPHSLKLEASRLRVQVCEEIKKRAEELEPFLGPVAEYCQALQQEGAWGGVCRLSLRCTRAGEDACAVCRRA